MFFRYFIQFYFQSSVIICCITEYIYPDGRRSASAQFHESQPVDRGRQRPSHCTHCLAQGSFRLVHGATILHIADATFCTEKQNKICLVRSSEIFYGNMPGMDLSTRIPRKLVLGSLASDSHGSVMIFQWILGTLGQNGCPFN